LPNHHQPASRSIADVIEVIRWAENHLDENFSIEDLAARAHVSRKTLQRHFHTVTGSAPLEWITARRMDRAKHLLETTDLPIQAIARRTGFHGESLFRYHWRRLMDGTPSGWRRDRAGTRGVS
jgi:transcriptional regulator GlxA family with amidase domain